ncbi:hypothetical protein [Bacillus sp. AK128]
MSKGFIQGFSIGIFFTTALLTATYYTFDRDSKTDIGQALTDESVANYLAEAEQTTISNEEYQQLQGLEDQVNQLSSQLAETEQKLLEATNEETVEEDSTNAPEVIYLFEIQAGMTGPEISEKLEELNIIKSSTELSDFLSNKGWEGSIQIGTFELSSTMSIEEIARKITKKP